MNMAARLAALNPSNLATYKQTFDKVFNWLKSSGLITSDYLVWDGLDTARNCNITKIEWSYHPGVLISALVKFNKITNDPVYMTDATGLAKKALATFLGPQGYDEVFCSQPNSNCKTPVGFGWPLMRGFADFYHATPDKELQANIKKFIQASVSNILTHCGPDFNCIRTLNPGK
jgi:rhamnogalacturonyl hydrolase YesR